MDYKRKLATIQRVLKIEPIEGADSIEKIKVLGWTLVSRKGEFKEGDLCVYFEPDSFLSIKPEYEFLRKSSYKKMADGSEGFRLRVVKLKGVISYGIALPISFLGSYKINYKHEGADISEELGVMKYELPIPASLAGVAIGQTPLWMITDETRVQILQELLTKYKGTICYISEKLDGSSSSYFLDEEQELHVCSRTLDLEKSDENSMWKKAIEYGIGAKLKSLPFRACLQGEIIGEGIQGNKYKRKGQDIFFFNVINIEKRILLPYKESKEIIEKLSLNFVPVIDENFILTDDIQNLLEIAKGKSVLNNSQNREGIVFRPLNLIMDEDFDVPHSRVSFKAINPKFALKEE